MAIESNMDHFNAAAWTLIFIFCAAYSLEVTERFYGFNGLVDFTLINRKPYAELKNITIGEDGVDYVRCGDTNLTEVLSEHHILISNTDTLSGCNRRECAFINLTPRFTGYVDCNTTNVAVPDVLPFTYLTTYNVTSSYVRIYPDVSNMSVLNQTLGACNENEDISIDIMAVNSDRVTIHCLNSTENPLVRVLTASIELGVCVGDCETTWRKALQNKEFGCNYTSTAETRRNITVAEDSVTSSIVSLESDPIYLLYMCSPKATTTTTISTTTTKVTTPTTQKITTNAQTVAKPQTRLITRSTNKIIITTGATTEKDTVKAEIKRSKSGSINGCKKNAILMLTAITLAMVK
ncbi:hypothetical protein EB796_003566 [Bugula neritina]|uniref:Uncharacterized protein n=1 Tax=Bugula neritina TaxID=10212 RepID=A0A7J7KIP9_BUGNE|nr:hypothetical protein EB796_003566 [Bugula neritina]